MLNRRKVLQVLGSVPFIPFFSSGTFGSTITQSEGINNVPKIPNLEDNISRLANFIDVKTNPGFIRYGMPCFPLDTLGSNSESANAIGYMCDKFYDKYICGDYIPVPLFECKEEDQPENIVNLIMASTKDINHIIFAKSDNINRELINKAKTSFKNNMNHSDNILSDIIVNKDIDINTPTDINVIRVNTNSIYESYKEYLSSRISVFDNILDIAILVGSRKDLSVACPIENRFGCAVLDRYAMACVLLKDG